MIEGLPDRKGGYTTTNSYRLAIFRRIISL
jgi:hypothetical protein